MATQGPVTRSKQHAISGKVPIELLEEAKAVPGIDLSKGAVQQAQDIISLRLEYQQATIARTAGTYASGNKVTLSGSSQWSHADSNPSSDIETAREAIRAKTGFYPNITLLSPKAFSALKAPLPYSRPDEIHRSGFAHNRHAGQTLGY
jgi:hypothetical protein